MATERDWEGLERKLRAGKTIDQAAVEAGIPPDELEAYFLERDKYRAREEEGERRHVASALEVALRTLRKIAKEGPREAETTYLDGKLEASTRPINSDLEAAKALLKFASDAMRSRKAATAKASAKSGQLDLFDGAPNSDVQGPWKFNPPQG